MAEQLKKIIGAVMVVGGGITGMQSALDLANSGFKVYLIEKTSSIGGRMSQLDKTFPTNDCSMCMISPKLIEVAKHRNIEIITNTEVEAIEGEEGNFQIKLLRQPRYVDSVKCSGCGDCIQACPVDVKNEFEQGLSLRKAIFKRFPQAVPGAFAITKAARPPCKITCPAGCNGQGYIALTSQGKYLEALNHIKQWIPIPAAVGRICHHPCEQQCNRGQVDEPLGIAPIKAFLADTVRQKRKEGTYPPEDRPAVDPTKGKVAIVGSGPSGLACAYDLIKRGYAVTIFEAASQPGGQLQSAIPGYRLPKEVLAADIQDIMDLGVELKLNTPIGDRFSLADLKSQGFQAIYLAIGAQKSRSLEIPGVKLPGVLLALDFLRKVNSGTEVTLGRRVVVIGGGNVAMDVARSARRLGASEVHAFCLESRSEMPSHPWEIEEAEEEGIQVHNSWGPKEIIGTNDEVSSIEFMRCTSVFDQAKRFNPAYDPKTTTRMDCDNVIIAIGQATDLAVLSYESKVKTTPGGWLVADPVTLATGEAGIFAGGDAVSGPRSAVEAIAHGHEAAISIERYLSGLDLKQERVKEKKEPAAVPEGKHPKMQRVRQNKISLERRLTSFAEMNLIYTEAEAKKEAERCLNCGVCSECLECVKACVPGAVNHTLPDKIVEIEVGAIVLATGFELFGKERVSEYENDPDVMNGFQFERYLCPGGPTAGQVFKPSDGKTPKEVVFISCTGSRDSEHGVPYCSRVCCMYLAKQAMLYKHAVPEGQAYIFYMDVRSTGKGYEEFIQRTMEEAGVKYLRGKVSRVFRDGEKLKVWGADTLSGKAIQINCDAVVLGMAILPNPSGKGQAEKLGVAVDEYGFIKEIHPKIHPFETSIPGIFVAGTAQGPKDIPDSVAQASGAASKVLVLFSSDRVAEGVGDR